MESMRSFRRILWAACIGCTACSLQFDNPEQATEQKISTVFPLSFPALSGRWVADSTYTLSDTRATQLGDGNVVLEFRPDSTFWAQDSGGSIFPAPRFGAFHLLGDSLLLHPDSGSAYAAQATLRFLGNYLELYLPQQQRYVEFHKLKPPDTLALSAWLENRLWLVVAREAGSGGVQPESLRTDFDYAVFHGDSLRWLYDHHGLPHSDSELFTVDSNVFGYTLQSAASGSSWLLQWVQADTLRLWPLHSGQPDSGFLQCAAYAHPHPFDLNCAFLTRYWRGDSLYRDGGWQAFQYGYYYDLGWDTAHRVAATTNTTDLPRFRAWDIDSGRLLLSDSVSTQAFVLDSSDTSHFYIHSVTTPSDLELRRYGFTAVDSAQVNADPIFRFTTAPYARVALGGDTLAYYWFDDYARTDLPASRFEVFGIFARDTLSLIAQWPEGPQTFSSALAGFRFAFAGRNDTLGRFICQADSSAPFALRLLTSTETRLVPGNFQGSCKVTQAERAAGVPADSLLPVSGDFRFVVSSPEPLQSPLWQP